MRIALALWLAVLLPVAQVRAQSTASGSSLDALTELRLDRHSERRTAGWALMGWGVANALGGGVVAAIRHDDDAWLAAGLVTAAFGVVNALLAPSMMDLSGSRERAIRAEHDDPRGDVGAIREREARSQLGTAQTFAFNTGLDVFYITAGLLLFALGHIQNPHVDWERGAGLALAIQGVPLLAFDIYNWVAANQNASALAADCASPGC
jgi:hypothetical protein